MTLAPDERVVVDASVAVKWVLPEAGSEVAQLLLDHPLVAPDLMFTECANILWKKIRRGELSGDEVLIAAEALEQADLAIVSTRPHFAAATEIAVELAHAAYDAIYLAVAESLHLRFVTADDRLIRRVRFGSSRFSDVVVALAEVP